MTRAAGHPSPRLSAPICGSLPAFLTYIALTLLLFAPLLPRLGAGLHDRSDTALNTWIIAWQAHILPRAPWALFDAPIFHPLPNALALSEILWPIAPLAVPLLAATNNPVLIYNLFFLAAFPLAGLAAYLLALRMTGRRLAAFLAGLIYAFSPHQFGHLSQLQLLSIAWLPLTLLFVDRFWTRGRPRDGFLFALCAAFQTLSAFYYGFQVALAVGLYLGAQAVVSRQLSVISCQSSVVGHRSSIAHRTSHIAHRTSYILHRLITLLPWIALAALLIAPFAAPYLRVRGELGLERSIGETLRNAATLAEWVRPPAANPLYRALPGIASAEGGLFPGIVVLGLAALGVIKRGRLVRAAPFDYAAQTAAPLRVLRDDSGGEPVLGRGLAAGLGRGFWLLLALTAVILSLGPQLKLTAADEGGLALPFGWLYEHVPGMTATRAPGRFANSAFLALAMLAASGAAWLLADLPKCLRIRSAVSLRGASFATKQSPPMRGIASAQTTGLAMTAKASFSGQLAALFTMISIFLLALLILAEYAGGLGRFAVQPMPPTSTPLSAWLADQPAAAIIELPLTSEMAVPPADSTRASTGSTSVEAPSAAWPDYNLLRYQYFQTGHWQPTADGYSGFVPPHHRELGLTLAHFPDARSLALLRGLGVERVIVHSAVMEAFAPGRAAALRDALATRGMSGVRLEREFGPEWVYRLPPASPNTGPVVGRFWSTADGQAFLLLAAPGGRETLIPPGLPLRVRGAWQAAGGAAGQSFEVRVRLPLLVDAGSVIPLDLPRPPAGGAHLLRVAADDARVAAPPFVQEVAVTAAMNEMELLAIQVAAGEIASGQTPPLAMTFATGQETAELAVAGGQTVTVTLPWRLLDRPAGDYSISARLLDAAGQMVAQDDRALSGGRDLVRGWQGAAIITTTHTLRVPPAAGRPFDGAQDKPFDGAQDKYRFEAFFYRPDDPTDYLFLDAAGNPAAALAASWRIGPAGQ